MGGRRLKMNPKTNSGSSVKKIVFAAAGVLGAGLAIKDKGAAAPAMKVSPASPLENDPHFLTAPLTGVYPVGVRSQYAGPLLIDIHYPGVQGEEARYKVHPVTTAKHGMSIREIEDPEKREQLENLWTRSQPDLQAAEGKFPVAIFSHGMGGNHFDNQNVVEELASHGYCVITVSHPASNISSDLAQIGPPDPPAGVKQLMPAIHKQAEDVCFLIDQIKAGTLGPNIDPDRIGVIGHSLGGDTALEACRETKAIRAGIDLDSSVLKHVDRVAIEQPFLTIVGGKGAFGQREEIEGEIWDFKEDLTRFAERSPRAELCVVPNADHNDFSLDPLHEAVKTGVANPHIAEINQTTNRHIVEFFDKNLKFGKGQIFLILGQSSVGKSSILKEIERQIPDSLSVDQDSYSLSQDAEFAKQVLPGLYARAEKALDPVYIARYFKGSTYPEMLHWKPGTSDALCADAMDALTKLNKYLTGMPDQYREAAEALDPAGSARDQIASYLKGLTPSERLPWKSEISSDTREKADQALKGLSQYFNELGEKKMWEILNELPSYKSKEKNQMGYAIRESQERPLVALDVWLNPNQFLEYRAAQKSAGPIKVGLAYCPFSELLKRIAERNAKALSLGDPNELRSFMAPIMGFTDFYRPAEKGESVLETLHRSEVEQMFETAFQQDLAFWAARASKDPNSKQEYAELAKAHDKMKQDLMMELGFVDAGVEKVDITPRFQGYDYLFNTKDMKPSDAVDLIRAWK